MNRKPWRLTRTAWLRLLLALSILLVSYAFGKAQTLADADGPAPAESSAPEVARSETVLLVLDMLAEQDPSTPAELLRAVFVLQPFEEYEEAKKYLARLAALDLTTEQLAALHAEFGSGRMIQLARAAGLAPEGRELAQAILRAAGEQRRDPARLRALILQLGNDSSSRRREARLGIAAAGDAAVPHLLAAIRRPPSGVSPAEIRRTLVEIGVPAEGALLAALTSPDSLLHQEAAHALAYVGSDGSIPYLLRPSLIGDAATRAAATSALRRLGAKAPDSPAAAGQLLRRQITRYLDGDVPNPGGFAEKMRLWTWSAEQSNVIPSELSPREVMAVAAARLARDLVELEPSAQNTQLLLAARMEVDQRSVGLDAPLPQGPGSAYELASVAGVDAVNAVLDQCLANHWDAAAIAATDWLGSFGEASLLSSHHSSPLVHALSAPNRRVRFSAARAIMQIDPRRAYPGASYLLETLAELAHVSGVKSALIGAPREDIATQIAGRLSGAGYVTRRASRGKDFLLAALESSDWDVFLLSDAVDGPPVSETLQQLRKSPRTMNVPVILIAQEHRQAAAERLASRDDLVVFLPEFADRQAVFAALEDAAELAEPTSVDPGRRLEQAYEALQWLVHLARYAQTYAWYDLSRVEDVAIETMFVDGLSDHAVELLGFWGSATAQKVLVDRASQTGLSQELRSRAAEAFREAVLRRGVMLQQADTLLQYDRYNASAKADESTQEILGQVLDTIEAE